MIPESPAMARVFVALPVYGGYHAAFVPCLAKLIQRPPANALLQVHANPGDSLVSRSRNRLAAQFLASDATHLLFLDTDLIFSPEQIERLISHDQPLVCGLYPKKQKELAWVCNTVEEFGKADPETGLQRVLYAGTGCMLIKREVFEKIAKLFPDLWYEPDAGEDALVYHDFFKVGVFTTRGRRRYLSEDWAFCEMAAAAGVHTLMDTRVVLKHVGEAVYPLVDPFEKAESGEAGVESEQPATGVVHYGNGHSVVFKDGVVVERRYDPEQDENLRKVETAPGEVKFVRQGESPEPSKRASGPRSQRKRAKVKPRNSKRPAR